MGADKDIVSLDEVYALVGVDTMKDQESSFLPAGDDRVNAVILAAGSGKGALGPIGADLPKAMLESKGKTILERQVAALNAMNIKDIAVVRGFRGDKIDLPNLRYYENPEHDHGRGGVAPQGGGRAQRAAKKENGANGRRSIILYGDILFDRALVEKLLKARRRRRRARRSHPRARARAAPRSSSARLVARVAAAERGAARAVERRAPQRQAHRPAAPMDEAHAEFVGMMMVTEAGARKLLETFQRALETGAGKRFHEASDVKRASLTDVVQALIDAGDTKGGVDVKAVETFKGWMEVDTFEDYQRAWAA